MPSTFSIRTSGARLGLSLSVALLVAAASPGRSASAQDAGSTPGNGNLGLRGTDAADAFRSEPAPVPPIGSPAGASTLQPTPGTGADGASGAGQVGTDIPNDQPNYGRPRKRAKNYGPRKPVVAHPLPELQRYLTAPGVKDKTRHGIPSVVLPAAPPSVAVIPQPEPRHKPVVDDAPFAPLGIDVGSLRLKPYIESDIGYDTNPQQSNTALKPSAYSRIEGGGTFQSNWSNHELSGDLRAGYSDYFSDHAADRPDGSGKIDARIDVSRDTKINLEGRFTLATQSESSPELTSGTGTPVVVGRPFIATYGGTAGVTQQLGRLALTLNGTVDRTAYGDAKLSDGSVDALSKEDYTAYGLRARAAYELKPGLVPFVEAFGDTRQHDQTVDLSGFARNSVGAGALVGTSFTFSPKLSGQVSTGYEDRAYADKRLQDLRGPLVDASVVWNATPLTTVTFLAANSFDETDIAGASGSISRRASLEVSHALFRNLTITGLLSYQNTTYTGIDLSENTYDAGVKAEYSLTRSLVVRGSFTHERLKSGTPGLDYTQNVFLLGLRLQE